jgi:hypothetical protein
MPFDPEKDKELKKWQSPETGLLISINRYGEGEAKMQVGPRMIKKKTGGESRTKAGRLTMEDVLWLYDIIDEIKDEMQTCNAPQ